MTGWADVALSELLGGVSEVLGSPFPQTPLPPNPSDPGASAPAIISTDELSKLDRARLIYMGINPDTAPLSEINKALERGHPAAPPSSPPPSPVPGTEPAGSPPATELTGAAADAARRLDDALAKNHTAINDADDRLADAVLRASSSSADGKQRLQHLQQDIIDEVNKIGPSLDTASGQHQLAEFLQGKTSDILAVLKNAGLDSDSQARVLDGLSTRYRALTDDGSSGGGADGKSVSGSGDNAGTNTASGTEGGPTSIEGAGTGERVRDDPLLDGLASDPMMSRLGMMTAPALGALGSLPAALGSAIPSFGGSGLGGGDLGDLGSAIGGALHDAERDPAEVAADEPADTLKDPSASTTVESKSQDATRPAGSSDQDGNPGEANAAFSGGAPPTAAAAPGQAAMSSTQVELPDNTVRTAATVALAQAGRAVLSGDNVDDAFAAANLQLPPLGAPVSAPISPSRLEFGDVGQYTDHRVMALSKDSVWINGQVTPIDQLETGPNFLGWTRVSANTAAVTTAAAVSSPSAPQVN
jgi:uncharacterized protein DUF4226